MTGAESVNTRNSWGAISMLMASAISGAAQLLVTGATPNDVREAAIVKGMRTMGNEAMTLVANDVTTIDEVVRNVYLA